MNDFDYPNSHTLQPTCTGTSVIALSYDGGVVVGTDRLVSYGHFARYKGVGRQYRVNSHCVVTFGGDHADFQWLQNLIERRQEELRCCSRSLELTPKMLHGYLTSFLYYRRCKMDPIWNTIIVAGQQPKNAGESGYEPFIGVLTQRGVAYETKSVATGLGAMLLNQAIETDFRARDGKLKRDDAIAIVRKAMELAFYHDCSADSEFDLTTIEADAGVVLMEPEKIVGNWDIAEYNCQYQ